MKDYNFIRFNTISDVPIRKLFLSFNKDAVIFERIKKGGVRVHRKPLYTNFKQNLIFS